MIKSGFCMSICPSAHFISLHIVKEMNFERVIFLIFYAYLKDRLHILLLILMKFKRMT